MKNFDTRTYNVSDFEEWHASGLLDLSPKFQRRSVWTEKAKSFLIDSILRGKPIPKIIITQQLSESRNIRTVVDGQQRLRTILSFLDGDFAISRAHFKEHAGKRFHDLPMELQTDIRKYEIGVDLLFDQKYEDILDIFARLNTYSVKLNSQELLNAQYLGYFKQAAYACGFRYAQYFIDSGVLSEKEVTRMAEAELSSDLVAILIDGIQSKKAIPNLYKKYDDDDTDLVDIEERFDTVMSYVGAIYPAASLKATNFHRVHLFYSLFSSIAHGLFGLKGLQTVARPHLSADNVGRARVRLDEISARYDEVTNKEADAPNDEFADFIDASRRATTDAKSRRLRCEFLCKHLVEAL